VGDASSLAGWGVSAGVCAGVVRGGTGSLQKGVRVLGPFLQDRCCVGLCRVPLWALWLAMRHAGKDTEENLGRDLVPRRRKQHQQPSRAAPAEYAPPPPQRVAMAADVVRKQKTLLFGLGSMVVSIQHAKHVILLAAGWRSTAQDSSFLCVTTLRHTH
jgi:hypothetical protein